MTRERINDFLAFEAEGPFASGPQLSLGSRICASEESNFVPLPNQLLCEVRNHSFRSAVELWRNTLIEGRDLRDFHFRSPSSTRHRRGRARVVWTVAGVSRPARWSNDQVGPTLLLVQGIRLCQQNRRRVRSRTLLQ